MRRLLVAAASGLIALGAASCTGPKSSNAKSSSSRSSPAASSALPADAAAPAAATSAVSLPTRVRFTDANFGGNPCPAGHNAFPARCYRGTANAVLPLVGAVSMSRSVIAGDQQRKAPVGCAPADTTGTLTVPGGSATFEGSGTLCDNDQMATYRFSITAGHGALAKIKMAGTIHNQGGEETWDISAVSNS